MEEETWTQEAIKEASELLDMYIQENNIKKIHKRLCQKFLAWYYLLKLKWATEKLLVIFTEICLLILLWKSEFTSHMPFIFKIVFSLTILHLFSYVFTFKDYKHGSEVAHVLNGLCERYPQYYILEEETSNGGDQGEQLQGFEGEESGCDRDSKGKDI